MSDDKTNHWNSLAEQVGAEIPLEPVETAKDSTGGDQPASPTEEPTQSQSPPVEAVRKLKERPLPPPPRKNHWGLVAGELGLEASIEDEPEPAETLSVDDASDEQSSDRDPEIVTTIEPSGESPKPLESDGESNTEESAIPPSAFDLPTHESEAVSMFAETEDAEFLDDQAESTESASTTESVSTEDANVTDESTEGAEDGDESEERPRRRRRRPRRRSRKGQDTSDEDSSVPGDDDGVEPVRAGDESRASDDEETSGDRDQGRAKKSKHRNIPTWEEAIGVVVSANIEAKAKSSNSGGSGRRGRGRGRGGSKR